MTVQSSLLLAAAVMITFAACKDNNAEYVALDHDWDAADSAYLVDYTAVNTANTQLEQQIQAANAAGDTAAAARFAAAQQKIAANKKALADMDAKRVQARTARDAARTAQNKAAYDSARSAIDYNAWKADLDRMKAEQNELQGTIKIGSKTVGAVDVNTKDPNKPLVRVEPGKNDNKPLIEKNKNPK
ncbi:MAG: hypothetical protein JWQ98_2378 [Chlorobi bacterium]|nr:hypothetical protein [Chlorobiota bacterium]